MANIKSAKKRILVNQAKTEENKRLKTNLKTVDQACAKGILKKNTASRKKSKLALHVNKANA